MRCAIGVYSQKLLRALTAGAPDIDALVITEREGGAEATQEDSIRCRCVYSRGEDYSDPVFSAVIEEEADVVHFQHTYDQFGEDTRLPRLLERIQRAGKRTVVSLHTVNRPLLIHRFTSGQSTIDFHRSVGRHSDRVIVHHKEHMADRLRRHGVDNNRISVIPHGTTLMSVPGRESSRRRLGIPPDAFVFLFFGFIHVQKNLHTVLEAFVRTARDLPQSHLLITGMPWGDRWYNHLYCRAMKARILLARLSGRVTFKDDYVPADLVSSVFGAGDVILLPHSQKYGSASGVFHQAIGADKPVLCASGPKFEDAMRVFSGLPDVCLPPASIGRWAGAMHRMATDSDFREAGRCAISEYARATAWPEVARMHEAVYRELLNG